MSIEPDQNELPPTEVTLEQKCKSWEERIAKEHRERLEFMATQPQAIPCKIHPDSLMPIDDQETDKLTMRHSFSAVEFVAGYAPCPKCVEHTENQKLKRYGVPENLIHAKFINFTPCDEVEAGHVEAVKEFCKKRTGFLILSGDYGTGKTHLAVAALRKLKGGWLVKQATLLRLLRATYSDRNADDPIERVQNTQLLILDDVGLSGGGKDELPMLHEILDFRHGSRLPTIVTSNLPFENLSAVLGERMADVP